MSGRRAEAIRARARLDLEGAARRMPGEQTALAELLEAAGRLEVLEPGAARTMVPAAVLDRVRRTVAGSLGLDALGEPSLGALAFEVIAALDDRDDDDALDAGDDDARRFAAIEDALAARDRVELQRAGAAALLGAPVPPDDELAADLDAFDALLRPELWRLTVTNGRRGDALGWLPADARPRFWWRFEGVDVDPRAVESLAAVAALVARFPEARSELEALVAAETHLTRRALASSVDAGASADRAPAAPRVTSLADWVRRRRAEAGGPATGAANDPIAVAASGEAEELELLARPDVELSFVPPATLVVDVLGDRAPGELPVLVLPDGTRRELRPVDGALERFAVTLDVAELELGDASLRVILRTGATVIALPPEEG